MTVLFLLLFLVPVVALCWRVVVTKTRALWLRTGAAAAAMTTAVGAFVVFDDLASFEFKEWRNDLALLAAMSGSIYLLGWALRPHGNHRHRTISVIAAIVGLVPVVGTLATTFLFGVRG
jgi:hypothetical protein